MIRECTSAEDLTKFHSTIQNYKPVLDSIDLPCKEMFVSTSFGWIKEFDYAQDFPDHLKQVPIRFLYIDKFYEEIEYIQDFGFESFWSGVGGFVGIFLGYSIMQLPELLGSVLYFLRKMKNSISETNRLKTQYKGTKNITHVEETTENVKRGRTVEVQQSFMIKQASDLDQLKIEHNRILKKMDEVDGILSFLKNENTPF